ncbi:MAG: hypothetical protein JHC54_05720 [Acinetobacter sp.]|nr:hypothetical protein [Acinetobacter sp.]
MKNSATLHLRTALGYGRPLRGEQVFEALLRVIKEQAPHNIKGGKIKLSTIKRMVALEPGSPFADSHSSRTGKLKKNKSRKTVA